MYRFLNVYTMLFLVGRLPRNFSHPVLALRALLSYVLLPISLSVLHEEKANDVIKAPVDKTLACPEKKNKEFHNLFSQPN
uniref:Uncharacterized protein n=1 Tax=Acrobeloides nanus TaxID=290746 RepID=A0A914DAC0_9BILA